MRRLERRECEACGLKGVDGEGRVRTEVGWRVGLGVGLWVGAAEGIRVGEGVGVRVGLLDGICIQDRKVGHYTGEPLSRAFSRICV